MGHHVLGQTEGGNAVNENAAGLVQAFKHGDVHAEAGKVTGARHGRGTGAYAGHTTTDLLDGRSLFGRCVVGNEAFQTTDGHGLPLLAENALAFALLFLRAHAAAHGGQAAGFVNDAACFINVALHNFGNEVGNGDIHGAAGTAHGLFALKATGGFFMSHFGRVSEGDFIKIFDAFPGSLAGHIMTGNLRPAGDFLTHD